MRDLDTSLLGQNENGLVQFDAIKKCTDELVNAILHVRQLLKRRRFEGMHHESIQGGWLALLSCNPAAYMHFQL